MAFLVIHGSQSFCEKNCPGQHVCVIMRFGNAVLKNLVKQRGSN